MIIDTHVHLDDEKFEDDLDAVLQRSWESGVRGLIIPGADINDLAKAKELAHKHEHIYFAAGVHPYHHDQYDEKILKEYLRDEKCIAVGECGLDYFRLPESDEEIEKEKAAQKAVFKKHVDLAKEVQKPLIVHIREANDDSRRILEENSAKEIGGVLHCYNASEHLLPLAQHGFYFGIGGVLTFKNARKLVEVLPKVPFEKVLLETDAPYLTPHPYRGKRNEPAYTNYVAQRVAEILELDLEEVHKQTNQNAEKLFKVFAK